MRNISESGDRLFGLETTTTMANQTAYVALGANLGEPVKTVLRAVDRLDGILPGVSVAAKSRVWHTAPHEVEDFPYPEPSVLRESGAGGLAGTGAPWYANMVARLECAAQVTPEALFDAIMALEAALGRNRLFETRYGPRVIDIDLLLFGHAERRTPRLTLPHPRFLERAFVFQPLRELLGEDDDADASPNMQIASESNNALPLNLLF